MLCYFNMDTNNNDATKDDKIIGYCMKEKQKREMVDVQMVEIKPGRPAAKGKCAVCGTGMYKIMPKIAA